jgi:hypothetical protein
MRILALIFGLMVCPNLVLAKEYCVSPSRVDEAATCTCLGGGTKKYHHSSTMQVDAGTRTDDIYFCEEKSSTTNDKATSDEARSDDCGVSVDKVLFTCMDEISGRNCSCLSLSNTCPYAVTVSYTISGKGKSSLPIRANGRSREEACTTRSNESVEYIGSVRRPE